MIGTVTVPITQWMLELDGMVKCDISIINSDEGKLTSSTFNIKVDAATHAGEPSPGDDDYDVYVALIAECAATKQAVEELREEVANIEGGATSSVLYTEQTLTEEQKAQARENIGALGATEKITKTIYATEGDIINQGFIKADGKFEGSLNYRCTNYIPIDFDDNTIVNVRCTIMGYAALVFYDVNKSVILGINDFNAAEYGIATDYTAERIISIPLPSGAAYVRMTGRTDFDNPKPEDLWISGEKTIDVLKSIGDVSAVLDELHNYAQALIGGES